MLEASKAVLSKAPWTMIVPGAAVIICVLSLNLFGEMDFVTLWIREQRRREKIMNDTILEIKDLHVLFPVHKKWLPAVDGVNLKIEKGEITGVVGESGSEKVLCPRQF